MSSYSFTMCLITVYATWPQGELVGKLVKAFGFSSVQFSRSVVSNSLRPHELQHTRLACPSPTPGVYPNSCPLSRWCHPAISSSHNFWVMHVQIFSVNTWQTQNPNAKILWYFSIQFTSVTQSCLTLCDLMDCSTPGLPVHHKLLEFTQTHVHWVGDAIQPSHPLSFPSPLAFDLSQHQGLFQMSQLFTSGGQSIGVSASTSVLPMNTQDWSPLGWTGWISLQSKELSRVFSNTTVQNHQFYGTQLTL